MLVNSSNQRRFWKFSAQARSHCGFWLLRHLDPGGGVIWGWQPACPMDCHMHERVVGGGDSGLDQRPGGPDVKFCPITKLF